MFRNVQEYTFATSSLFVYYQKVLGSSHRNNIESKAPWSKSIGVALLYIFFGPGSRFNPSSSEKSEITETVFCNGRFFEIWVVQAGRIR